jgi:hypothetical protein
MQKTNHLLWLQSLSLCKKKKKTRIKEKENAKQILNDEWKILQKKKKS